MQDRCKGEPEAQNTVSTLPCLGDRPGILSDIDLVSNETVQDYATIQFTILFPCLKRDNGKPKKKKKMINFYEVTTDVRYWQLGSKSLTLPLIKQ